MKNFLLIVFYVVAMWFFGVVACNGQVSVIHFNSEWNSDNDFNISTLKECKKENVIICHNPELKDKYDIISVPTIIIFDDGIEVDRFEANLMLELTCTKKDIQKVIDKIMLKRFE
ncbi:MAG: hypothetical protein GOVbin7581_47 [Prokaryotic dsDNA virus sp.]|nr:MAG: hypothetical protein GOVbin7581_47 [Prokaryotic dsDNA virus sp.]|tara:strand:+ start:22626 stop:22970 length:345 start_codon:yes stop_codon:yes gene_type:complete